MKKLSYAEQLKHPNWQKKRLEVLSQNDFECQICGEKEKMLHVHHKFYKKNALVWDYENDELQCLCSECHESFHNEKDFLLSFINKLEYEQLMQAASLIDSYFFSCSDVNLYNMNPHESEAFLLANFMVGGNLRLDQIIDLKDKLISRNPKEDFTIVIKADKK